MGASSDKTWGWGRPFRSRFDPPDSVPEGALIPPECMERLPQVTSLPVTAATYGDGRRAEGIDLLWSTTSQWPGEKVALSSARVVEVSGVHEGWGLDDPFRAPAVGLTSRHRNVNRVNRRLCRGGRDTRVDVDDGLAHGSAGSKSARD